MRLDTVRISRILYEHDYQLDFTQSNNLAILYGLNGVGKTKLLEIIEATCNMQAGRLAALPFESIGLSFSDGTVLGARQLRERKRGQNESISVEIFLDTPGQVTAVWSAGSLAETTEFEMWLQTQTSWSRVAQGQWQDTVDGEVTDTWDLVERYNWAPGADRIKTTRMPTRFAQFARRINVHLIEAQRLQLATVLPAGATREVRRVSTSSVARLAQKMRTTLTDALSDNARISQDLERTFPMRFLSERKESRATEKSIRQRYTEQDRIRRRLADISASDVSPELSLLPDRALDVYEISLLDLYLKDADRKLKPLEALLDKIELVEDIVSARLKSKALKINSEAGLTVSRVDNHEVVPLDHLSSGEQHELILMCDLFFNSARGSLIMIDEPEISLHVGWQIGFLDDIGRIAELEDLQFIVATHSPQIINQRWSLTHRLGEQDPEL